MGLRCKPGDLAVTSGLRGNENNGRIVQVLEFMPLHGGGPTWLCRAYGSPMECFTFEGEYAGHHQVRPILDSRLTPIRDQPGEDETLAWAPVPGQLERV